VTNTRAHHEHRFVAYSFHPTPGVGVGEHKAFFHRVVALDFPTGPLEGIRDRSSGSYSRTMLSVTGLLSPLLPAWSD